MKAMVSSRFPRGRSDVAFKAYHALSPCAAASTASCPGCARCDGSRLSTHRAACLRQFLPGFASLRQHSFDPERALHYLRCKAFETKECHVIVDVRTYQVKPGKMPQELDLYGKRGLAPQTRHLGPPLAYLHGESGDINTLVHLWVFEDVADRARKRAAMMSDPEWQTYLKLADEAGFLVDQRNSLMVPASFAPIKR